MRSLVVIWTTVSLLYGVADYQLCRLQAIQNAAARVVIGLRKLDHVLQVLRDLRWLTVRKRVVFKIAKFIFKCLRGQAPPYLTEHCFPVSSIAGRRHLRSADTQQLYIPRSRTVLVIALSQSVAHQSGTAYQLNYAITSRPILCVRP
jgi:hypothetical protein